MPVESAPASVSVDDVRDRVNADNDGSEGRVTKALIRCLSVAQFKVAEHTAAYDADVAAGTGTAIPDDVRFEAILSVAAELFEQQKAPNGILNQQYATDDNVGSIPIRISADPLRPAYPLLGQWVLPVAFA